MDLPQLNEEGYAKASALATVPSLEGSLLLCHGLLDENVLFRQSAVLVNALIKHRKAYDLALFPSERHGPRRQQDRAFLEERILAFLQRSLGVKSRIKDGLERATSDVWRVACGVWRVGVVRFCRLQGRRGVALIDQRTAHARLLAYLARERRQPRCWRPGCECCEDYN